MSEADAILRELVEWRKDCDGYYGASRGMNSSAANELAENIGRAGRAVWSRARSYCASSTAGGWMQLSEQRPAPGSLIVKRWKRNGSVWAGVYIGTDKDSSFDEWCHLPPIPEEKA